MVVRLFELLVIGLLAMIPGICAIFQSVSVIPRRRDNITSLVQSALSRWDEAPDELGGLEQQRSLSPESRSRLSPAHYLAARGGTERLQKDFSSEYGGSFIASAVIVTLLYFAIFWLGLSILSGPVGACVFPGKQVVDCIGGSERLKNIVFAALGAYIFNMGVIVRRAFLSDVTEHVFWSAINRLLLSAAVALVCSRYFDLPYVFFGIAFVPRVLVSAIKRAVSAAAENLSKSDNQDKTQELPLDLVQGIDIWKEQRMEEEGIESVENLATSDVLTLAVKTHYPLRTLIDWIDQAILINRLPGKLNTIRGAGLPVSAIEFAWMSPENSGSEEMAKLVATTTGFDPLIAASMMNSMYEDAYVNALWSLWQTDPEHRDVARSAG
jgi:hypothetical protein